MPFRDSTSGFRDKVYEIATTIGSGPLMLTSVAQDGFQRCVDAYGAGNPCYYIASHRILPEWEVGTGSVTILVNGQHCLLRQTIIRSSSNGAAVDFSAGVKDVRSPLPASVSLVITGKLDAASNLADLTNVDEAQANLGVSEFMRLLLSAETDTAARALLRTSDSDTTDGWQEAVDALESEKANVGYRHLQTVQAATWTINHNRGSFVRGWDALTDAAVPLFGQLANIDINTAEFRLNSARAGSIVVY